MKKLANKVTANIRTTMIGSIDTFEKNFGHLWGWNKTYNQLTDGEKEWRKIWEDARTEILDKGNDQLRLAETNILSFGVDNNKNYYRFYNKERGNG